MQPDVKSFMTGSPISIEPGSSALAALDLMLEHAIRHLPVVDEAGRPVGVVSFDDLRAAFPFPLSRTSPVPAVERDDLRNLSVGEVMTYGPVTLRSGESLRAAAERMAELRIGCLIVVDADDRLDGILTETDLLYALATSLWTREPEGPRQARPSGDPFVVALHTERLHLAQELEAYQAREQAIAAERHDTPLDEAESGSDVTEASLTEGLADLAARRLRGLDHALERAARGALQDCERCGGRIPLARLRALPGTTLCVRCARSLEEPTR